LARTPRASCHLRYEDGKPVEVTSIVLSTQHTDPKRQTSADIRAIVEPYIREVLPEGWLTKKPNGTSTRPAPSSSAARTAMPA
jgi:S-adenosylmethionine synthetase